VACAHETGTWGVDDLNTASHFGEANYRSAGEECDPLLFWRTRRALDAHEQQASSDPARERRDPGVERERQA
jgi:hypothetical protein